MKFLIAINPKIAIIFYPGTIGSTYPSLLIFLAIISDPASPNPSANKAPILIIVDSKILVSYNFSYYFYSKVIASSSCLSSSSKTASSSAILAASKGFFAILLTFYFIFYLFN